MGHKKTAKSQGIVGHERIYDEVRRIPKGRVATYGQIAALAGIPRQPRRIGYALSALKDNSVPWHRVVNAKGEISRRADPGYENYQRILLEEEGVVFDANGRIALDEYRWGASPFRRGVSTRKE